MMYSNPLPPRPDNPSISQPASNLEQALGERQKLNDIKQKMNATYPPKQPERKKAFSSSPTTMDI